MFIPVVYSETRLSDTNFGASTAGTSFNLRQANGDWFSKPDIISFQDFVSFDDNVAVSGTLTDDKIVQEVTGTEESTTDDNPNETEPEPAPTGQEVRSALNILRRFTEFSPQAAAAEFNSLHTLEMLFEHSVHAGLTQSTLDSFLNK